MKKVLACLMAALILAGSVSATAAQAQTSRGGIMGFIAGCCFGVRAAGAYNDGKELHWREWVMLVPVVNLVVSIWNGIDGANGWTTRDFAAQYGSAYY
ncbi:MAG: hypothetical protein N2652_08855 [Kiritimatiellae bacterium]|nr:hypothetical protein [Kiritimatiellia bacterium]